MPLLLLLAFGTAEMGMAWVANNRVEGSTSTAARIAASQRELVGGGSSACLQSLQSSLPQEQLDRPGPGGHVQADHRQRGGAGGVHQAGGVDQPGRGGRARCNTYAGATVPGHDPDRPGRRADDFWAPDEPQRPTWRTRLTTSGCGSAPRYGAKTGTFFDDMTITKTSDLPDPAGHRRLTRSTR